MSSFGGSYAGSYTEVCEKFSEDRFLEDVEKGAESIGAPYSESVTKSVLEAFRSGFHEGCIQLRATSRRGDPLTYRVLTRKHVETIDIAIENGFLEPDNEMIPLVKSWRNFWPEAYEQCDFTAGEGLRAVFIYLGRPRHLAEVLSAPLVPDVLKKHQTVFEKLNLELVQSIGVDYLTKLIGFYFIARGPLTEELAAEFCALAGCEPPPQEIYDDMSITLGLNPFFFTVTVDSTTGAIVEVQFYIMFPVELPEGRLPEVGPQLTTFWDVDSYEQEEMDILSWSFSREKGYYMVADRGYVGGLRDFLRDWKIMTVEAGSRGSSDSAR